jgi:hypothetical protein
MKRENNKHRRALEKIAASPGKFGFENSISISIETNLFHCGRLIAQPDLIIEVIGKEVYVIEYKGNGNGELMERAQKQLQNTVWWYARHRPDISHENIHAQIISGDDPKYRDLLR